MIPSHIIQRAEEEFEKKFREGQKDERERIVAVASKIASSWRNRRTAGRGGRIPNGFIKRTNLTRESMTNHKTADVTGCCGKTGSHDADCPVGIRQGKSHPPQEKDWRNAMKAILANYVPNENMRHLIFNRIEAILRQHEAQVREAIKSVVESKLKHRTHEGGFDLCPDQCEKCVVLSAITPTQDTTISTKKEI